MSQDELEKAYDEFADFKKTGVPLSEFDPICNALTDYLWAHPNRSGGGRIGANRVMAILAVKLMAEWEKAEFERE